MEETFKTEFLQICTLKNPNKNNIARFNYLINFVDVNCIDKYGRTPLILLCVNNQSSSLIELIKSLLYIGTWKHFIFQAIKTFNLQSKQQANVNHVDSNGYTAFIYLCTNYQRKDLINIIKLFIENGVNLNYQDKYGFTGMRQLFCTTIKGNLLDILNLMILNGFSPNLKDYQNRNLLHIFCEYCGFDNSNETVDIIQKLLESKIDVSDRTIYGKTALHFLCECYSFKDLAFVIQHLLDFDNTKTIINITDDAKNTALHYLCKKYINNSLIDVVELLVEREIDINAKDYYNKTALLLLCEESNKIKNEKINLDKVIKFLVKQGADVFALGEYKKYVDELTKND